MPDDYSNPMAPPDELMGPPTSTSHSEKPLRNEDFRKLLTTPRVGGDRSQSSTNSAAHSFTHKGSGHGDSKKKQSSDPKAQRRSKHVRPKKEDEDDLSEIMKNYRDRAKERREETEPIKEMDLLQATAGYRAMAPDVKSTLDAAERRKQMIEESKYLGGDMEHTHLVKGLDYALLQKVRSEIVSKEKEGDELQQVYLARKNERDEVESQIKSPLAKNLYNMLFKPDPPKLNELFAPRRMAYVVELDEDLGETDIPTTLIRSKQECPVEETSTNASINDIVIQKLTQVLAYLRSDGKKKKKEKGKEKMDEATRAQVATQGIFEIAGDYVPTLKKSDEVKKAKKDGSYFDRPAAQEDEKPSKSDRDREKDRGDREKGDRGDRDRDRGDRNRDRDRRDRGDRGRQEEDGERKSSDNRKSRSDRLSESLQAAGISHRLSSEDKSKEAGGSSSKRDYDPLMKAPAAGAGDVKFSGVDPITYAECYPGAYESYDAADDSDDEVDYSKMDLGNRKGPIRRWDFDTDQEYEEYMSRREALPKAAFQYGVKMNDGRKTRKGAGQKTEADQKAKIDRQWNQISNILSKREGGGGDGSESVYKKPKY